MSALSFARHKYVNDWQGGVFSLFVAILCTFCYIRGCVLYQSVSIGDTGITAYLLWKKRLHIAWQDVKEIEHRRLLDGTYKFNESYNAYCIKSAQGEIKICEYIEDFPEFLTDLKSYVRKYNIPLVSTDAARDTLSERRRIIEETITDPVERKRWLREGAIFRTPISTL